ncbi:uncharacterized protein LOC123523174 isoform X4 [Mercenaria mercenaria]|uniref:uncharacterized protein LOC123523174 isoform X4 n=1 Tax=Mercenaria mercenaria TaxID=6596 RepID=UPI001E1DCC03|nr:uncharacterized protein LOC123523174 isoform X4 [Mercenaria mercenaria]
MAAAKGAKMYSLCGNVFFCFLICLVGCVKEIAFPFQACVLEELLGFEKEELLQVIVKFCQLRMQGWMLLSFLYHCLCVLSLLQALDLVWTPMGMNSE